MKLARYVALAVPFAFYYYTCAPGIGLGDTALLVDAIERLTLGTHATIHNLTILFDRLFFFLPGENLPRKANLASAVAGGLAVAGYGLLLQRVLRSTTAALVCMGVLMVSHSMWWHSTIAEVYALNGVLTVAALWLLFAPRSFTDRRLYALFFMAGLGLFNHAEMGMLAVGATVALVLRMVMELRCGHWVAPLRLGGWASLAFLAGLGPWLWIFLSEVQRWGWQPILRNAVGGNFQSLILAGDVGKGARETLFLVFQQFPGPFLLAIPVGLLLLARRRDRQPEFWALAAMLALNVGFFLTYDTWDKFAFLLPAFILLAFAGAVAVDAAWSRPTWRLPLAAAALTALILPPWFYAHLAVWGREPGFWHARYNNQYTRNTADVARYIADPNKRHYRDVEQFAELLFAQLPAGAVYIDDDSRTYDAVAYLHRSRARRPDLRLAFVNSWGFAGWGLDKRQFAQELQRAYRQNGNLFLVSLDHPFQGFLDQPGLPRHFTIFGLGPQRWVYRLVTAAEQQH